MNQESEWKNWMYWSYTLQEKYIHLNLKLYISRKIYIFELEIIHFKKNMYIWRLVMFT